MNAEQNVSPVFLLARPVPQKSIAKIAVTQIQGLISIMIFASPVNTPVKPVPPKPNALLVVTDQKIEKKLLPVTVNRVTMKADMHVPPV